MESSFDPQLLSQQLLRAIRGSRSQNAINRRLHINYNQISRWETGRTKIPWDGFLFVCRICKVPVNAIIADLFGSEIDRVEGHSLLRVLFGTEKIQVIAKKLEVSRFTVQRWLAGKTTPDLADILKAIDHFTPTITLFIRRLVEDIEDITCMTQRFRQEALLKQAVYGDPYCLPILCFLEIPTQARSKATQIKAIAEHFLIPIEQVESIIASMERAGFVKTTKPIVRLRDDIKLDIRADIDEKNQLRAYWSEYAHRILLKSKKTAERSCFGFSTFAASEKARQKIREAYYRFYHEHLAILEADDEPKAHVQTMNVQIIDFTESQGILR